MYWEILIVCCIVHELHSTLVYRSDSYYVVKIIADKSCVHGVIVHYNYILYKIVIFAAGEVPLHRKQRARNRWLVAYTVLHNPSLAQWRA